MNGPGHYLTAERLLGDAAIQDYVGMQAEQLCKAALAHATLAQAALKYDQARGLLRNEWRAALGHPPEETRFVRHANLGDRVPVASATEHVAAEVVEP